MSDKKEQYLRYYCALFNKFSKQLMKNREVNKNRLQVIEQQKKFSSKS